MRYYQAFIATIVLLVLAPVFMDVWTPFWPGVVGDTVLTTFELLVLRNVPYIFVAVCVIVIFVGVRRRS